MMDCKQCQDHILEQRPAPAASAAAHMAGCAGCARLFAAVQQSSALLDEFAAPEPSPFFDTRFYARMSEVKREEAAAPAGFFARLRAPRFALAGALAVALAFAVPGFLKKDPRPAVKPQTAVAVDPQKGTAVADLQALEDQEVYAEIDLLDEIEGVVVETNPANNSENGTKL